MMRKEMDIVGNFLDGAGWMNWLSPKIQSVGDFIFFRQIMAYLQNEIHEFGIDLLGRAMQWVSGIALTLLTLWIMIQGYRIVTGQSRESMMALVTNSLRSVLILTAATMMAMFGTDLHKFLNDDVKKEINWVVTGENTTPEDKIDENLAWMQVALSSIDALDVMSDPTLDNQKSRAMWFAGVGAGGPAIVGGTLLLLYEVAMALFVGFGPIFILCLMFDQTKSLFQRWLLYGIGTMFSMAVLSAMVSIALEMVVRVSAAFWGTALVGSLLGSNFSDGMTSQAMQQGGMGMILTLLIVSVPPMAAAFFQGTLGNFMHFSAFSGGGAPVGQRAGESGYRGGYGSHAPPPANTTEAGSSRGGATNFNDPATNPNYGKSVVHTDEVKNSPRRG
jgi:type IV secretion system protein VirB6